VALHDRRRYKARSGCDVQDTARARALECPDELLAPARVLPEAEERTDEVVVARQPREELERVFLPF
jgi:hypothetical protein